MKTTAAPFKIRLASQADIPALSQLGLQTYRETFIEDFGIQYPPEDEVRFSEDAYGARALEKFFQTDACQHFLAEIDGRPVAYALTGQNTLPHPLANRRDGEFKRLYVTRAAQGSGVGRALFECGMEWLEQHYPGPVWLGVWENNQKAKEFYLRRGFVRVGEYTFRVGKTEELDWILRKP